ncbi:membrane protein [Pseudomonas aeruginosa]|nr:membrane protein [Pseudomonas aeruginosa]
MSGEAREGLRSPWLQAGRLAFLALFGVTLLAALAWAFSNVRQIGPENRAVVLRLGALERLAGSRPAGWPGRSRWSRWCCCRPPNR